MPIIAVVGDLSSHGGVIVGPGSPTHTSEGGKVSIEGDLHACPIPFHVVTPIVAVGTGAHTVDGMKIIGEGSIAGCGAVIIASGTKNTAV